MLIQINQNEDINCVMRQVLCTNSVCKHRYRIETKLCVGYNLRVSCPSAGCGKSFRRGGLLSTVQWDDIGEEHYR